MKSKLSAILAICMLFMFLGCFSVYAEDDITENTESIVVDENPIIPVVPDIPAVSQKPVNAKDILTIECRDNDVVLSNMSWNIYKVADFGPNNTYLPVNEFSGYNVKLNGLSTSEMVSAAETLEAYALVDGIKPLANAVTDSSGITQFEDLSYGLYLLSGSSVTTNDNYYLPTPSLVRLDNSDDEGVVNWNYNVTTLPKLTVLGVNDRVYHFSGTVKKIWENDNEEMRPESITVILVKDDKEFSKVVLSDDNNWTYTWDHLSSKYKWTVIEKDKLENYTASYTENNININPDNPKEHDVEFIIVNTGNNKTVVEEPAKEEKPTMPEKVVAPAQEKAPVRHSKNLPQTGQLWWPVPSLSALGLISIAIGWKFNSNKRKKYEK